MSQRFLDEARITAQLQHPGIPPVFEVGRLADERPYLAMKLIKGRTLEDLLDERSEPASDRGHFLAVFQQICQAVGYAHSKHILHRDLKPANVMVGAFGEVQVMDWGLAKLVPAAGGPRTSPPPARTTADRDRYPDRARTRFRHARRQHARHAGVHGPRAGGRRARTGSTNGPTCSGSAPSSASF